MALEDKKRANESYNITNVTTDKNVKNWTAERQKSCTGLRTYVLTDVTSHLKTITTQDRQSTYNVTMRRVRVTTVTVEKQ
jgi:hypothetical protein